MIENGLSQLLVASAAITAIVPNDVAGTPQVYWVLAPKGAKPPYIVLSRAATEDPNTLQGDTVIRGGLFQIDCYTDTKAGTDAGYLTCRQLSNAVRGVLDSYHGTLPDADATVVQGAILQKDWDMPYQEGGQTFVFRIMLQYRIWYIDGA